MKMKKIYQQTNNEYIKKRFGSDLSEERIHNLENAIKKYENNYWWESKDPVEIAKYQIFEPILMVDFQKFHEGLEILIRRPVYTHEFALNIEGLRKEVNESIKMINKGKNLDNRKKDIQERESKGVKALIDYINSRK